MRGFRPAAKGDRMKRYLHLIFDDKFCDAIIERFDAAGLGEQTYLYYDFNYHGFHYIKHRDRVRRVHRRFQFRQEFTDERKYDVVVIHSLLAADLKNLPEIPARIKVLWCIWGYDIYGNSSVWRKTRNLIDQPFFFPATQELMRQKQAGKAWSWKKMLVWLGKALLCPDRLWLTQEQFEKAIHRVDYCGQLLPVEFELLRKNHFFKAKYVDFNYQLQGVDFSQHLVEEVPDRAGDNNLLIGNSATETMNHADTFLQLQTIELEDRKIVVPLSYGNHEYALTIKEYGERLFPRNFMPLMDFLPAEEYTKILSSCGYAVFNCRRQQALGNLYITLWQGGVVFLPDDSCVLKHFLACGAVIFPTSQIPQLLFRRKLTAAEMIANRNVISRAYAPDMIRRKTEALNEAFFSDCGQ